MPAASTPIMLRKNWPSLESGARLCLTHVAERTWSLLNPMLQGSGRTESKISNHCGRRGFFPFRLICSFVLLSLCMPALADIPIPDLSSPVIDDGNFFDTREEQYLSRKINKLYESGGPQFQIWTIADLEGEPVESVTIRAAEQWKLGRQGKDDGLILAIAKKDRRFRLEVGRGLEPIIPDALASRLLKQILVPALRRNSAGSGANDLLNEIMRLTLSPDEFSKFEGNETAANGMKRKTPVFRIFIFLLVLAVLAVVRMFSPDSDTHHRRYGRRSWSVGGWNNNGWGGGGGGGGGWSGGGGGFSGGGSSGGW